MTLYDALQVLTLLVLAVAMSLALAHALEWPGKRRLTREQYEAVQPIYYPGFTVGGMAEPAALVLLAAAAALTPVGGTVFWLTVAALAALAAMHAAYWLLTHPVNSFWLKGTQLGRAGRQFFGPGPDGSGGGNWHALRDRWERSHAVRAALGLVSLGLMAAAVAAE